MANKKTTNNKVAQGKIVETIYDDFLDASKVIEAKTPEEFEEKCEKQYAAWEKEKEERRVKEYKENRCQEALDLTSEAKKRLQGMFNLCKSKSIVRISPISYMEDYIKKPRKYMERSLPQRDDYIAQEIRLYSIKKWLKEKLGIKWFDQQFEEAEKLFIRDYEATIAENDRRTAAYNEWAEPRKLECEKHMRGMKEKNPDDVWRYFLCALEGDNYAIGGKHFEKEFKNLAYDPETRLLSFSYKLPNLDDLALIKEFSYSEKEDEIKPQYYSAKEEQNYAIKIANTVLLRAIATIFLSDVENVINSVNINGFVKRFVKGLGNYEDVDFIQAVVNRDLFDKVNLDEVDASSFFTDHVKAEYKKELYEKTGKS